MMSCVYQTKLESFIPRQQLNSIMASQLFSELIYSKPTNRFISRRGWKY